MTILIGVDFSPQSMVAIEQGFRVARLTQAEAVLLHVGPVDGAQRDMPVPHSTERWADLMRTQPLEVRAEIAALENRYHDVATRRMLLDAHPESGLAEAAAHIGASLVVVGTHGRTGLSRFFLGSIAERVVRIAPTNVLVARPWEGDRDAFAHILVPTDFSERAKLAVRTALSLSGPETVIDLVHFWQLPMAPDPSWHSITNELLSEHANAMRAELEEHSRAQGRALLEELQLPRERAAFRSIEGRPARGIQQATETAQYDLVVMGSHGRRGIQRWLLGSVAEATVRYARSSVLVVRAPEAGGEASADSRA